MQGLAFGTADIVEAMRAKGVGVSALVATGGLASNPVYLQEHANATGCPVYLLQEADAMVLGSAMVRARVLVCVSVVAMFMFRRTGPATTRTMSSASHPVSHSLSLTRALGAPWSEAGFF